MKPGRRKQLEPDWSVVARELKRKHVTLQVLWEEYITEHADGYRYSRWCELFRRWEGRLPLVMRQSHGGGEKLFVDYAGDTVPVVVDRRTGEIREAHLFVAVMGGSSLSFALATWTEQMPDWIDAHNAAFAFFGEAPQLLIPDNAKVAVIKACHFDPMVNRGYTDMARHYGTAVLPARLRKPRDKAKIEACVGIVERWLLGRFPMCYGHEFQALFHWHVEDLGIRHAYIKPSSPQLNGKVERSLRSDQQEFYQLLTYKGNVDLEERLDEWERFSNFHRPHGAFKGKTPYEALRERL